jgi:peptide methionine sulfoxide reductase MsrB
MIPFENAIDSPTSEKCLEKDESATHILCECEAIAYLRFRHLGHCFMESDGYHDAPVRYCTSLQLWDCCAKQTIEGRGARASS